MLLEEKRKKSLQHEHLAENQFWKSRWKMGYYSIFRNGAKIFWFDVMRMTYKIAQTHKC